MITQQLGAKRSCARGATAQYKELQLTSRTSFAARPPLCCCADQTGSVDETVGTAPCETDLGDEGFSVSQALFQAQMELDQQCAPFFQPEDAKLQALEDPIHLYTYAHTCTTSHDVKTCVYTHMIKILTSIECYIYIYRYIYIYIRVCKCM